MSSPRDHTAFCGLYCGDCIPSEKHLFKTVKQLKKELDETDFDRYAYLRSQANGVLIDFPVFVRVLEEIEGIECAGPCATGGGKKRCPIRDCVQKKGYRGCWECAKRGDCTILAPLKRFHGDTIEHNLEMIRRYGIDNWAEKRGKHYPWRPSAAPAASELGSSVPRPIKHSAEL